MSLSVLLIILALRRSIKPPPDLHSPHQQQCRSDTVDCYKSDDSFDKVECCFDIVAVFGNNVACSICFEFVERTKFYDKLVQRCCRFLVTQSNVASTLLLVWTRLYIVEGIILASLGHAPVQFEFSTFRPRRAVGRFSLYVLACPGGNC